MSTRKSGFALVLAVMMIFGILAAAPPSSAAVGQARETGSVASQAGDIGIGMWERFVHWLVEFGGGFIDPNGGQGTNACHGDAGCGIDPNG